LTARNATPGSYTRSGLNRTARNSAMAHLLGVISRARDSRSAVCPIHSSRGWPGIPLRRPLAEPVAADHRRPLCQAWIPHPVYVLLEHSPDRYRTWCSSAEAKPTCRRNRSLPGTPAQTASQVTRPGEPDLKISGCSFGFLADPVLQVVTARPRIPCSTLAAR